MQTENKVFTTIIKRDGSYEKFNPHKITMAITKAGQNTGEFGTDAARKLTLKVLNIAQMIIDGRNPSVEAIQDIVEEVLLSSPYKKTAKAYIIYREQHSRIREIASKFNVNLINQYLGKTDWQVKENSNMSYSLQGLNNYIASEISKNYWLNQIYPENVRDAHIKGDFHIHDLNILSVYCVGWDLLDLLMEGFTGVEGKVSSKPPRHFRSALGQIVNFFYTLQGEAAGAQAFSNFDTLLSPFIRYDNLTYKEVRQALQEFIFNINVPTRVGFQTPFTNITLDLKPPIHYSNQPVIIGGQPQKETYREFQEEMNLFNRALLEVMATGDASERVFTFPIPTFNITKDFEWDSDVSRLLWRVAGKYGLPYFSNFINSDMNPEDARSMCCRLRIDNRQLEKRGGGLFGANPLTGSIGVVTINLPRIGIKAETKEDFFETLKELMITAKNSLEIKRKVLENFTESNLFPYTKFYLRNIKTHYSSYWGNHFSTIGIIGMNEAIQNMFGKDIASAEGKKFSKETLLFMKDMLISFQAETGNNYNLEATPAEGASYRLALLDQKNFENAIFANGKGKDANSPFYTNSTNLPVNFTDDIFEALDLQDDLQAEYTGGTVLHLFVGERINDSRSIATLVRKICQNYKLPYFTLSPTFSVCPNHGYISGEVSVCDKCQSSCEVYSRIVGYLRPVSQWNNGKKSEFEMRKTYQI